MHVTIGLLQNVTNWEQVHGCASHHTVLLAFQVERSPFKHLGVGVSAQPNLLCSE